MEDVCPNGLQVLATGFIWGTRYPTRMATSGRSRGVYRKFRYTTALFPSSSKHMLMFLEPFQQHISVPMAQSILCFRNGGLLFRLCLVLDRATDVLERHRSEKGKFRWKRVLQQTFYNLCKVNTKRSWKLPTSPKALVLVSCETTQYATIITLLAKSY